MIILIVFDVALSFLVWKQHSKPPVSDQLLADIHIERQEIMKIRQEIMDEISSTKNQLNQQFEKIKQFSSELDADVQDAPQNLKKILQESQKSFLIECDKPLQKLTQKQLEIEGTIRKIQKERKKIQSSIEHGEVIIQSLHNNRSWDDVINDIQNKKYDNARSLLAQGMPQSDVMMDLGLSHTEIQLLK